MANLLICDDDRSLCTLLEIRLRRDGHRIETANDKEAAMRKIGAASYDVIVSDIRMPQTEDGMQVLQFARRNSPDSMVILITAVGELETAIQAVRADAFDYILKEPNLVDKVTIAVARALETASLRRQNYALKRDAAILNSLDNIIGASTAVARLKQTVRTVASTSSTVLVHGESGTGKELVARALHACSPRGGEAFVSINCGAFPETLLESELFGYVKGAFTGATQNKRGLFEVANGGTIFLDEISEMSVTMQVKLLRVLQERVVRPVGATQEVPIDVRVIAATNREINELVASGEFREDLYYRISVIPIHVAPLRDRRDDIPMLAAHFLKKYAPAAGKSIARIATESLDALCTYDWPGNVRQLENTIERAVAMEAGSELRVEIPAERPRARAVAAGAGGEGLPAGVAVPADGLDMERYVAHLERALIESALRQSNGVQTRAAELLKLSYRSFRHLIKKYDI